MGPTFEGASILRVEISFYDANLALLFFLEFRIGKMKLICP
jgi:hypothetical protein